MILLGVSSLAHGQRGEEDVPLMRPDEREVVEEQSDNFNNALVDIIDEASKSTVRIWGKSGRRDKPVMLAYGTVVGDGSQVLTKWSEVEASIETLQVQTGETESFQVEVAGVFTGEDLVLLNLRGGGGVIREGSELEFQDNDGPSSSLVPAEFYEADLSYGRFLTASQPSGRPAAFGVVSVLERNLRETDQAHLGIIADANYRGKGVRIRSVQAEYGASEAGLQAGDVILAIGERKISGLQELKNALTDKQPGDGVSILVETAGKERTFEVQLSNRPLLGQFSGGRLNNMERMGGEPNRVRDGFSRVVQSDMQIKKNQVGGPVVDLDGRIVGITIARADRTRTYIIGSSAVMDVLKGEFDTVAEARAKIDSKRQELASQRRAMIPNARPQGKPQDLDRMKRNLSDLERLLGRANEELGALDGDQAP